MNLEEVKQFIKQVGYGMLATTDGRKVGVRPMGGLAPKPGFFERQNQGYSKLFVVSEKPI